MQQKLRVRLKQAFVIIIFVLFVVLAENNAMLRSLIAAWDHPKEFDFLTAGINTGGLIALLCVLGYAKRRNIRDSRREKWTRWAR
jgi:uncharacterized integral membrane protein